MMVVDNKFEIGQFVYLVTDHEQLPRIVTAIIMNKYDHLYELSCGVTNSRHYDFELAHEKSFADPV